MTQLTVKEQVGMFRRFAESARASAKRWDQHADALESGASSASRMREEWDEVLPFAEKAAMVESIEGGLHEAYADEIARVAWRDLPGPIKEALLRGRV